ncbi:3D domain-containing protein [Dethiobacter alkaliphilus]|uniref:3D domain protein n=1 Tax=Dethiobacter alkaliphilus AHT 1 TaxID=555088 RepID=C0GHH1_DETAL|nr:3D domain-containing protein [Dethiobacter alkaliphilus]EEG77177.1 3D domain protein [Dethiobacter alkaliphilus AHT 1]
MTLKQLLLVTALVLLVTLANSLDLRGQVQLAQREASEAREEAEEELRDARRLELESEQYETQLMKITKYAPLSPDAVPGWDFAGDPSLTASGEELIPGKTAAAGPNVPFGTRIYVEGIGWFEVQDRGSAIGPNDIDLAVESREESLEFGIQERLVIFELGDDTDVEDEEEED